MVIRELRYCLLVVVVAASLSVVGCEKPDRERTSLFEQAETHYLRGEYGAALDDYQAFLKRHPQSPLAQTARMRIRAVNREVESVMGRQDMPRPDYTGGEPSDQRLGRGISSSMDSPDTGSQDASADSSSNSNNSSPNP